MPRKVRLSHPKCCICHTESYNQSKYPKSNKLKKSTFSRTPLSTLSKLCPSSPKTAPAPSNDIQNHLSVWPAFVNVLARCRKCFACHADETVSYILYMPLETGELVKGDLQKICLRNTLLPQICAVKPTQFATDDTSKEHQALTSLTLIIRTPGVVTRFG